MIDLSKLSDDELIELEKKIRAEIKNRRLRKVPPKFRLLIEPLI